LDLGFRWEGGGDGGRIECVPRQDQPQKELRLRLRLIGVLVCMVKPVNWVRQTGGQTGFWRTDDFGNAWPWSGPFWVVYDFLSKFHSRISFLLEEKQLHYSFHKFPFPFPFPIELSNGVHDSIP
jgi:hypothetical protein